MTRKHASGGEAGGSVLRAIILVGICGFSLCGVSLSSAQDADLCGKLASDATIGPATDHGPYVVNCDLTIAAGATLTIEPGTVVRVALGDKLIVDGRLIAQGTNYRPVVFTSIRDDDSGAATPPAAGDWQGIVVQKGGQVELHDAIVRYAATGVRGEPGSSLSVRRSFISKVSANAIRGFRLAAVAVTDSTVGETGRAAMIIDSAHLDPEDLSGNVADAGAAGMQLGGTFTHSGALKEKHGLIAQIGTDQRDDLSVAADATLAIPEEQIVKGTLGRKLIVDGRLIAESSNLGRVIFTSIRDDSTGGDTGGDGATPPAAGDWQGIVVQKGGQVELHDASIRYAATGVRGEPGSSLSVRRSFISKVSANAIRGFRLAAVAVTDSAVGETGGAAMIIDSAHLDPEELSGNMAGGVAGMQLGGTFTHSGVLKENGLIAQIGTDQRDDLTVAADATLAIPEGQILKGTLGRKLIVDGRLIAEGTNHRPVTFTSVRDDRRDCATPPAAGDWQGIVARPGSTVRLEATTLRYATTALTADRGATVEVHGRILDSTLGIAGTADPVDATNVYWGDPSGPAPIGTGVPFTGSGVAVQPWIGYGQSPHSQSVASSPGCTQLMGPRAAKR